jgi:hypothetical protein
MDVNDLYGLPLDRFVDARGELAKALRGDGRREEAKEVAGLRKPSVAAWAVNQLVRTQRAAVGELLAAGDALRDAHAELMAGRRDPAGLRTASERERAAVDVLLDAARGLLTSEGARRARRSSSASPPRCTAAPWTTTPGTRCAADAWSVSCATSRPTSTRAAAEEDANVLLTDGSLRSYREGVVGHGPLP